MYRGTDHLADLQFASCAGSALEVALSGSGTRVLLALHAAFEQDRASGDGRHGWRRRVDIAREYARLQGVAALVEEEAVRKYVYRVRRAMLDAAGDSRRVPPLVMSRRGLGYRLAPPYLRVEWVELGAPMSPVPAEVPDAVHRSLIAEASRSGQAPRPAAGRRAPIGRHSTS